MSSQTHSTFFRAKQPRILFGACTGRPQGPADALAACLDAEADGADFFACQIALSADGHLCCAMENACAALLAGQAPALRGLDMADIGAGLGRRAAPLGSLFALAARLSLPLALLVPDHVTAGERNLRGTLRALTADLAAAAGLPPLLLASGDSALLAACHDVRPAPWALGLVVGPGHSCDAAGLVRGHGADLCLLPKQLATDCRLCGLRETDTRTMVIGDCAPKEILRLAISGADGFIVTEPGPLAAAFGGRRQAD
ncbi:MAG: hypothetical protein Q4F72_06135 [Desulfovibrionaceae bacterium]|nr:hypothetical protein [Desulfovibrionaceae bacterium]